MKIIYRDNKITWPDTVSGVGFLFALLIIFLIVVVPEPGLAATVEYTLTVEKASVNLSGRQASAMTINNSIPGPVLRFKEGDRARIHVRNAMELETSIHWHGVLVPPGMDGVPFISFPPIAPGTMFTYEFPIRQNGTYWYHSHTNTQEQLGVYGAIIIEPVEESHSSARDYVVLLSDWTDEDPHEVLRSLKRGSDWYALQKGSSQSIIGAARLGMLGDYFARELQRMSAMDIADVAYDRFLVNGKPEIELHAGPGEIVRLRIIDGSATTYFYLEFAGGPVSIVAADGQNVEPFGEGRFLIGVAETYDILIKMPASGSYEFRATAHDGSGYASVWIGSGERHPAADVPRPNLYHAMGGLSFKKIFALTPTVSIGMSDHDIDTGKFDRPGMMEMDSMKTGEMDNMQGMDHSSAPAAAPEMDMNSMDHSMHGSDMGSMKNDHDMRNEPPMSSMKGLRHEGHTMPMSVEMPRSGKKYSTDFRLLAADVSSSPKLAMDGMDRERPWPPYDKLRALRPTAFSKERTVRDIRLTLDGDMERYVWFLNNKPLSESDSILIRQGEVVRFIMVNRTMMHHPMHLHGHFFRVVNSQGDYAPLKHTVDVAPMSTTVIEFDANEFGDWFFHCHLLYHMESGMARVVHYEGYPVEPGLAAIRPALYREMWHFWGQADLLSNMTEGFLRLSNTRNIFTAEWEAGWQKADALDWEGTLTWDRYINRFLSVFAGADLLGTGDAVDDVRGVLGLRYLLPLNIETRAWVDSSGGARIALDKVFQLTPRIRLFGEAQYDTHDLWEGKAGISYTISKSISLIGQWHSEYGFGGGLKMRF